MKEQNSGDVPTIRLGYGIVCVQGAVDDDGYSLTFGALPEPREIGSDVERDFQVDPLAVIRFKGPDDLAVVIEILEKIFQYAKNGKSRWVLVKTDTRGEAR